MEVSVVDAIRKQEIASRGKSAEDKVKVTLESLALYAWFDYNRLPDARACMGRIPTQIADFQIFFAGHHGVVEVKEVKHSHLLPRKNITQLPKMKLRELAGGYTAILIFSSVLDLWTFIPFYDAWICNDPSFNFKDRPKFQTATEALLCAIPELAMELNNENHK